MTTNPQIKPLQTSTLADAADKAARAIPPVWPLASSVAVNPYLGQTGEDLAHVAARLARVAGTPVTMPRAYTWRRSPQERSRTATWRRRCDCSPPR